MILEYWPKQRHPSKCNRIFYWFSHKEQIFSLLILHYFRWDLSTRHSLKIYSFEDSHHHWEKSCHRFWVTKTWVEMSWPQRKGRDQLTLRALSFTDRRSWSESMYKPLVHTHGHLKVKCWSNIEPIFWLKELH